MGRGFLKVQLYVGDYTIHGDPTTVLIKRSGDVLFTLETDENGKTPEVELTCPDLDGEYGLAQKAYFTTVDVVVPSAHGYMQVNVYGVQIFDGITSILDVHLEPYVEGEPEEENIYVPPEHGVDEGRTPPEGEETAIRVDYSKLEPIDPRDDVVHVFNPKPIDPDEYMQTFRPSDAPVPTNIPLANEVVIPEFITVHLGSPNATARNVRVRFRDYVVNVVCSEIYPFWHRNAIIANTHAIVSFALNRLFTHWYRSRGRNFDITNNTQFDQKFIYGREIFQNVALIVDGIFNQFIRRPGRTEPYLSSYCNGTTSTCPGMSQHGSQALAVRGFTPLEILRHYYPSDINIVMSTNFGPRNPGAYPGTPLREGSTGEDVRRMQFYLNRISGNWWIPAIQNPNGVFGPDTRATVVAFQRLFNLNPDGVVGPLTWYEITRVYVAARRMAELDSEGQRYSIGANPPTTTIRLNARGEAVIELQFLLNFIGTFYDDIPFVVQDNVFRESTRVSVIAFQQHFGLNPDGVVGPLTWARLYEVYRRIRGTVPTPPPDPSIPPFPGVPLTVGSRGNDVTIMQRLLNCVGRANPSIETLAEDGIFGPRTQAAVREFQRLFGLNPDGAIGQLTWYSIVEQCNLLQGATPPPPPPPPPPDRPPYPGNLLRVGSRGEDVRTMQRMLNNIGRVFPVIAPLNEDGIFGPLTEASVRAFQTFFGLNPDGIIGPLTWARIVEVNATLPNITAPRFPGNLQTSSRGDNVRVLQQHLNELAPFYPSIPRLNADGIFGPITQSAVVAFQRIFGMTQSGIVNQTTWNLIVSMRNLLTQGQAAQVFEQLFEPITLDDDLPVFMPTESQEPVFDGFNNPTPIPIFDTAPAAFSSDMFILLLIMYLMRNRHR